MTLSRYLADNRSSFPRKGAPRKGPKAQVGELWLTELGRDVHAHFQTSWHS